jgi:hypothetical protein
MMVAEVREQPVDVLRGCTDAALCRHLQLGHADIMPERRPPCRAVLRR